MQVECQLSNALVPCNVMTHAVHVCATANMLKYSKMLSRYCFDETVILHELAIAKCAPSIVKNSWLLLLFVKSTSRSVHGSDCKQ